MLTMGLLTMTSVDADRVFYIARFECASLSISSTITAAPPSSHSSRCASSYRTTSIPGSTRPGNSGPPSYYSTRLKTRRSIDGAVIYSGFTDEHSMNLWIASARLDHGVGPEDSQAGVDCGDLHYHSQPMVWVAAKAADCR